MFDNGAWRSVPFDDDAAPDADVSRVVGFAVDTVRRTVRQEWAFVNTSAGKLYSSVAGNAEPLPNGNVLADFGYLTALGDRQNEELGIGDHAVRIVEFAPATLEEVWHLSLTTPRELNDKGWHATAPSASRASTAASSTGRSGPATPGREDQDEAEPATSARRLRGRSSRTRRRTPLVAAAGGGAVGVGVAVAVRVGVRVRVAVRVRVGVGVGVGVGVRVRVADPAGVARLGRRGIRCRRSRPAGGGVARLGGDLVVEVGRRDSARGSSAAYSGSAVATESAIA